ncbi:hypothetical protein [Desulfosarcina cetonica]|nr:hypothetical protein [Desulfosarcina cetonica]
MFAISIITAICLVSVFVGYLPFVADLPDRRTIILSPVPAWVILF